ncbi:MAG: hypothetical protein A2W85_16000 [Bacteroidetes bacterium GWF2_41_31]|nr:MAG: hypothetical protein A2W85_16000 [Bacteroidetes bacterium GWF2_41_31]
MIKSLNIHPNQELIRACQRNDRKAQMMLYKNYYKAMYHTANRILENPVEAEDVMQEAFIDAFQKISQLSDEQSFGAWLKRIVINKALDVIKREKTIQSYREMIQHEILEDEEVDDQEPDLQYQLREVQLAMQNIPDQYRIVLSLHLFEGMDYEEMGQILNLEYNNVKTKYSRARQRLIGEIQRLQNQQGKKEVWHVEN